MTLLNSFTTPGAKAAAELMFPLALQAASFGVVVTDATRHDNPIVSVNNAFCDLTGYQPHEIIGRNCRFLQGPETDPAISAHIHEALQAGSPIRREILNYKKNGDIFWNDLHIDPIRDQTGAVIGFIGIQYDVTAAHLERDGRRDAEARLESIMSHLPGFIFRRVLTISGHREITYFSPSIAAFLGLGEIRSVTGTDFAAHLHADDRAPLEAALARSAHDLSAYHAEYRLQAANGSQRWFRSNAQPRRLDSGDIVWDGLALDITAEKTSQAALSQLARHDALTGLANRAEFRAQGIEIIRTQFNKSDHVALLTINLSAFQDINDTLGPVAGDAVLRETGHRIANYAQANHCIAARLGADEFAVLVTGINREHALVSQMQALASALSQPLHIAGSDIAVNLCIGAALRGGPPQNAAGEPDDRPTAIIYDEMIKQADLALRAAKQVGPGSCKLYKADIDSQLLHRMTLRQSLRRAVVDRQFLLHYQPLVDLTSGAIIGAEALVRWNHPELGLQRPDIFIPLAEETGAIAPLGAWIMQEAMRQHQVWKRQGLDVPRIAINVSSAELGRPGFLSAVQRALQSTGASPRDFEFELTEGLLTPASQDILAVMRILKSMGFGLALDDFGTGFATFKYLRDFPVDKVKIDQCFIKNLNRDTADMSIVRAVISLSRDLGLLIVAEGIETPAQHALIRAEGCVMGQGYLFSRPLPPDDFAALLARRTPLPAIA